MLGALGDDDAGKYLRRVADDAGVDMSAVATLAGQPTGRAVITVGDDTGENTIVVVPGANSAVHVDVVPNGRVVLAQLEVPLDAVVTAFVAAKQRGAITILNPAPATELPTELLAVTDVVVPNEHEIGLIGGVEALLDLGVSTVIVTRGASGVEVSNAGHRSPTAYAALAVEPIDTTGAGDAFNSGFAVALAEGRDLVDAVRFGVVCGGIACTKLGVIPGLPARAEADAFYREALETVWKDAT